MKLVGGAPAPSDCELYHVHRDALFSFHQLSEAFLQKMMGLYTSAHYKNSPNDLQMLSDAPAHAVFVLLNGKQENTGRLPDIIAVVQVALEGKISRKTVEAQLARGHRSAGDLIPWTISQQFGDSNFGSLSGARIVRIAVHPSLQGMGYGTRAVDLLVRFYNGEIIDLDGDGVSDDDGASDDASTASNEIDPDNKELKPRKNLPPLLLPLTSINAPRLDWIGTSFGITCSLQRFWNRCNMTLLYLRQTVNQLTGEHTAIVLRSLQTSRYQYDWLPAFHVDSQRRLLSLFAGPFRHFNVKMASDLLSDSAPGDQEESTKRGQRSKITNAELSTLLTPYDQQRLDLYARNLCDHHLLAVSKLYFSHRMGPEFSVSKVQEALLCGIGLQLKTVDQLAEELRLPSHQILAMFNKSLRKISKSLAAVVREDAEGEEALREESLRKQSRLVRAVEDVAPTTLAEEENVGVGEVMESILADSSVALPPRIAKDEELSRYVVKGSDKQWEEALQKTSDDGVPRVQITTEMEKKRRRTEDFEKNLEDAVRSEKGGKKKKIKKKKK